MATKLVLTTGETLDVDEASEGIEAAIHNATPPLIPLITVTTGNVIRHINVTQIVEFYDVPEDEGPPVHYA